MTQTEDQWFAITVNPKSEFVATAALQRKGFEAFLPTCKTRHLWSDRSKELDLPLFAGYIFCRFTRMLRTVVLQTPGTRAIVSFGGVAAPIPNHEIEALQKIVKTGIPLTPCEFAQVGQRVRIQEGALEGMEGILLGTKKDSRLVLSVTLLQRSVSLELDGCLVSPLQ